MSQSSSITPTETPHPDAGDQHGHHDPNLAHHFDSMGQQFDAGKLGMWVFLATEILMFGGLFCAYAVYRANHPEVFYYAHHFLSTTLGGINTVVLIASSLTMAWAVRAAQLGQQKLLVVLLALTVMGGFGFLCIKTIEYNTKAHHGLWLGTDNIFHPGFKGDRAEKLKELEGGHGGDPGVHEGGVHKPAGESSAMKAEHEKDASAKETKQPEPEPAKADPAVTGRPEPSAVAAPEAGPQGVKARVITEGRVDEEKGPKHPQHYETLAQRDQETTYTFFLIYFCMTGLHSFHVIVGMFLIFWLVVRAAKPGDRKWIRPLFPAASGLFLVYVGIVTHSTMTMIIGIALAGLFGLLAMLGVRGISGGEDQTGDFGPRYFAPVDIVGLYWHLVDLIWIFLFPLLYLIH